MPETVLIVDDASSHLRMTEYAIGQKLGYHAVTAAAGKKPFGGCCPASSRNPICCCSI